MRATRQVPETRARVGPAALGPTSGIFPDPRREMTDAFQTKKPGLAKWLLLVYGTRLAGGRDGPEPKTSHSYTNRTHCFSLGSCPGFRSRLSFQKDSSDSAAILGNSFSLKNICVS